MSNVLSILLTIQFLLGVALATASPHAIERLRYLFNGNLAAESETAHFRSARDAYVQQAYSERDRKLFAEVSHLINYTTNGEVSGMGYEWLANITDKFGNRHVGSDRLERAIDYVASRAREVDGFDNVHTQDVPDLPNWKRGEEIAILLLPREYRMDILATGGSPSGNVTADVIVVNTFDELDQLSDLVVKGRIVVFNQNYTGYGSTTKYRKGAKQAAARGAVGVLIRSVTPFSIYSVHTGQGAVTDIPSACITIEDAEMMQRMQDRGERLRVHFSLTSHHEAPCTSRNLFFDITGSELPKEIVLMSCHFDSWDVGQGAMDDGGGCAVMWQALTAIKELGLRPKRTIRVAFWTAEEQGMYGAKAYHKANPGDGDGVHREKFIFVSESDEGIFRSNSWNAKMATYGSSSQRFFISYILAMINLNGIPIAIKNSPPSSLGDVAFWPKENEQMCGAVYVNGDTVDRYFQFHHTKADTMTVIAREDVDYTSAVFASIVYAVAQRGF